MYEHSVREKYVTEKLVSIVDEFKSLFLQNNGEDIIPPRMQLICGFTVIDVLSHYWFLYLSSKTGTQSERFLNFVNSFCFTEINDVYTNSYFLNGIDAQKFCDLRNSLVHFYGIGRSEGCAIVANYSNKFTVEFIRNIAQSFRTKIPGLVIIQPQEIRDLIVSASILMLERMMQEIEKSQTDEIVKQNHIAGIGRIYNKLINEGAEGIA